MIISYKHIGNYFAQTQLVLNTSNGTVVIAQGEMLAKLQGPEELGSSVFWYDPKQHKMFADADIFRNNMVLPEKKK